MIDQLTSGLRFYQSANADPESIKEDFIIRLEEYDIIMDDIRRNPMNGSVQHYLLLGRRGSGKSTLLKRIQVEIDEDAALQQSHIAINLAEEQANIYRLYDLLEAIIDELNDKGIDVIQPEPDDDTNNYSRNLFAAIHEAIEQSSKKIVLLLDNIDRIFINLGEDQAMVRELLLNFDDIKIIGGSTKMTEHFWKYDMPFYEFFRVLELKPLTTDEIKLLLLKWSEKLQLPQLKKFVEERPGQLETVRRLTDGLPRTLQFFVNILINHTQETGYEYLKRIMDMVTPLYQDRLNHLPPAHRKIVLQMAFIWEAAGAKEIALATHMENKVVSAQIGQLIDKDIAEKVQTDTKNNLYRLSERFFNLWLIFTQGSPKEKRKAKCLTIFLENFYDAMGLVSLAVDHLKMLKEHKIDPNSAAIKTKAFAQSKYIPSSLRDMLIDSTLQLGDIDDDLKKQIPETTDNIANRIQELLKKNLWPKAIKLADTIEQEDGIKENFIAYIHSEAKNYEQAEKYYLLAIKKGNVNAIFNVGLLYDNQGKYELAEKYYLLAIEKDYVNAIFNLGLLYDDQGENELAEKYYLQAIDKDYVDAIFNLGLLYDDQGKNELAEKYYLQAIDKGNVSAIFNLALLYYHIGINKKKALELINKPKNQEVKNREAMIIMIIRIVINVWNGKITGTKDELKTLIKNKQYNYLAVTLENLLYHYQVNLVNELFEDPEFGESLIERYQPIYYAVRLLLGKDHNLALKIPPEIKGTVDEILSRVKEKQEFYYGGNKLAQ